MGATTVADEAVASALRKAFNGGGNNLFADDRATAAVSVGATTAADEAVASALRNFNGGGWHDGCLGLVGATTAADEAVASAWHKADGGGGHDGCFGRSGLAFPVSTGGKAAGSGAIGGVQQPGVAATAASAASAAGATAAGSVDDRHGGTTGWQPLMLLAGGRGGVLGTGRFCSPPGDALSAG